MLRGIAIIAIAFAPSLAHAVGPTKCTITGTSVTLEEVQVKPQGHETFELGLVAAQVTAELPATCGDPITLHLGGALEFTATRTDVWFRLTRDVASADGFVSAKRGAQVIDVCMKGDRVMASLVLYSDDVLEGEKKRPNQHVRGVELPCDALTLDSVEAADEDPFADGDENDRYWEMRGEQTRVTLHATAFAKAPGVVLDSPSCIGCIYLRQLKAKKGWIFVEASGEGASVRGWVPTRLVKRIPPDMAIGRSYMCSGDHGGGGWGESPNPKAVDRTGTVRAGTVIYVDAGRGAWGTFVAPLKIKVRITTGSSWAELRDVPGLDGSPRGSPWLHGVIALDTVKLDP